MSFPGRTVLLLTAALPSFACAPPSFTEDVSGIARLSIVQVALLAQQIMRDDTCGFESSAVKGAVAIEGEVGERGRASYRVDRCDLGFDAVETVVDGCGRDPIKLMGRSRVTATLVVEGVVSGRSDPLIPAGPDAVTLVLEEVVLDGFRARFGSKATELVMREGALAAEVRPRLARAEDTAFCSIPTGDIEVRSLIYEGAGLLARDENGEALVFVARSNLSGQIGRGAGGENTYSGSISVGGQTVELPAEGISSKLDDDYERDNFESGFGCGENLARPVDYDCACDGNRCHPDAPVADGVARLLPFVFGNIVALIEEDTTCGFSSSERAPAEYDDTALGEKGTATQRIDEGCRLTFAAPYRRGTDCHGISTFVEGTATVTGTRSARGYLTGDLEGVAVVPASMDALEYFLRVELEGFSVWTSSDTPSLVIESGVLKGTMRPTLAFDPNELACVSATPHAAIEGLMLESAEVQVVRKEERYPLEVAHARLEVVVGAVGDLENALRGTVDTGDETFEVPSDGAGLMPDYDAERFDSGFACEPNVSWPTYPSDCTLSRRLGPDVARAAALLLTTAASRVVSDDVCGVAAVTSSASATAEIGAEGTVTTSIAACVSSQSAEEIVGDNCYRTQTYAEGIIEMTGARKATGRVVRHFGRLTVEPLGRLPYDDRFDATFRDYRVWSVERDADTPIVDVHFKNGGGAIDLVPVMGESEEEPGIYNVPTPVVRIPQLMLDGVEALVASEGRHFSVRIDAAELQVESGRYQGRGNALSGYIVLDGERVEIPTGTLLDEDYDQVELDGSYACTPGLLETIPPD